VSSIDSAVLASWRWFAGLFVIPLLLIGCGRQTVDDPATPTLTPLSVSRYENELAFDLLYPSNWSYEIITQGLILFGEPDTVNLLQPGASLAVLRQSPLEVKGGMDGALQHYLESGPLSTGYVALGEATSRLLGGKDALQVMVEREALDGQPPMRAHVVAAESDSGPIYILSATAPAEAWDESVPLFQVLMGSFEFNE
jgi:hypothetical protein